MFATWKKALRCERGFFLAAPFVGSFLGKVAGAIVPSGADVGRFEDNRVAAELVTNGGPNAAAALQFLKGRGQINLGATVNVQPADPNTWPSRLSYGPNVGPWASPAATNDAKAKYNALAAGLPAPERVQTPLEQAAAPLREAVSRSVADVKEAAASSVERIGVGAGAAGAKALRGGEGPLDKLISFAKSPKNTVTVAIGAVVLVVLVAVLAGRATRR